MSHVVAPILPDRQGWVKERGQEREGVTSSRKKVAEGIKKSTDFQDSSCCLTFSHFNVRPDETDMLSGDLAGTQ